MLKSTKTKSISITLPEGYINENFKNSGVILQQILFWALRSKIEHSITYFLENTEDIYEGLVPFNEFGAIITFTGSPKKLDDFVSKLKVHFGDYGLLF